MITMDLAGDFLRDLRHAGRVLRINWGFMLTAVLTITLGIGVNTNSQQHSIAIDRSRTTPGPACAGKLRRIARDRCAAWPHLSAR